MKKACKGVLLALSEKLLLAILVAILSFVIFEVCPFSNVLQRITGISNPQVVRRRGLSGRNCPCFQAFKSRLSHFPPERSTLPHPNKPHEKNTTTSQKRQQKNDGFPADPTNTACRPTLFRNLPDRKDRIQVAHWMSWVLHHLFHISCLETQCHHFLKANSPKNNAFSNWNNDHLGSRWVLSFTMFFK